QQGQQQGRTEAASLPGFSYDQRKFAAVACRIARVSCHSKQFLNAGGLLASSHQGQFMPEIRLTEARQQAGGQFYQLLPEAEMAGLRGETLDEALSGFGILGPDRSQQDAAAIAQLHM